MFWQFLAYVLLLLQQCISGTHHNETINILPFWAPFQVMHHPRWGLPFSFVGGFATFETVSSVGIAVLLCTEFTVAPIAAWRHAQNHKIPLQFYVKLQTLHDEPCRAFSVRAISQISILCVFQYLSTPNFGSRATRLISGPPCAPHHMQRREEFRQHQHLSSPDSHPPRRVKATAAPPQDSIYVNSQYSILKFYEMDTS